MGRTRSRLTLADALSVARCRQAEIDGHDDDEIGVGQDESRGNCTAVEGTEGVPVKPKSEKLKETKNRYNEVKSLSKVEKGDTVGKD